MKIVVFETEDWERNAFTPLKDSHDVLFADGPLTCETASLYADAEAVSVFIYSGLNRQVLENLPRLRLVATRSTGYDHIDAAYCRQHDITVCNVPSYGENTVAEHVFGLLLAISHHLCEAFDRTRRGDFSMAGLQGFDLRGKTMGVIGTGRIGLCVIRIAKGFGMNVLATDIRQDLAERDRLGFRYVDMETLLGASDIVTLHVPANEQTRNLLSTHEFRHMKRGSVLINTARGSVVDVEALLHALTEGPLLAAGLDVLPEEPAIREEAELLSSLYNRRNNVETLLADHVLLRLRNVFITPHSAFNTREAILRILDTTVGNIRCFAKGEPQNVLNGTANGGLKEKATGGLPASRPPVRQPQKQSTPLDGMDHA